jgi:glycosyltransferase involved in cell wall biosynthesis
MNSRPLVSSIMIFLNVERFLEEAIESVLAQTYDNWELLLVDDGSTDDSTRIALRYSEQHPEKVRYLEHFGHQNRGKATSRNLGISQAKGEYFGFLDADDVWLPHALEQQVAILNSHPEVGMVYGSSLYWFGWTGNPEDRQRDFRDFVEECGVKPNTPIEPPELLRVFLRRDKGPCVFGSIPPPCSVLVRSEVTRSVGGFEDISHPYQGQYDDQIFFVKVALEASAFAASECWSKYRRHPDSTTIVAQKANLHLYAQRLFFDWIAEYLFKRGVQDAGIWKLLHERQLHNHNKQLKKLERALDRERRKARRSAGRPGG